MNKDNKELPSAQYFASFQMFDFSNPDKYQEAVQCMIEFAQMHVERALKKASEEANVRYQDGHTKEISYRKHIQISTESMSVHKESIINAYPLSNIK